MKDLETLSRQPLQEFLDSFDFIISDIDGVLFNITAPILNATDAIESLKNLGKKILYLTNNSSRTQKYLVEKLNKAGFAVDGNDLSNPIEVFVSYLKRKRLSAEDKIFLLGMPPLKEALVAAGFQLAPNGPDRIPDSIEDFVKESVPDDGTISVVISDVDVNLNYVNIQKAITYLRRPEVDFLKGAEDPSFPLNSTTPLLGPGFFHDILEKMSGRTATRMGKKSLYLKEYMEEKYGIDVGKRVLFIGDSVTDDIACGKLFGCQTLLVLSGITSEDEIDNWSFEANLKPDYYVKDLGVMHQLLGKLN